MKKVIGIVVFFAVLVAGTALGGSWSAFLDIPSFIMVVGLTLGLSMAGYSYGKGSRSLLSHVRKYAIYSGWLTFITGFISYLAGMEGSVNIVNFAVCLIGLLYGYLISIITECFLEAEE